MLYHNIIQHGLWFLARHEVKIIDILVVVHDLELGMKRSLYGFLCNLGIQYIVGRLCWVILTSVFSSLHLSMWSETTTCSEVGQIKQLVNLNSL